MIKYFPGFLLLSIYAMLLASCSSSTPEPQKSPKLLTFDIYDQKLEDLMEVVAERYDLDLDFDVDASEKPYSLSVHNASIEDVLRKISSTTGFYSKIIDGEIIVEEEILDADMIEVNLPLNANLWKDIRQGSEKIVINEETVQYFFGPLFSNVTVEEVNPRTRSISVYMPKVDVPFIKKSLLYLNYLNHQRNLAVTLWVVDKNKADKFLNRKAKTEEAEFAWKLNAGDNLKFTDQKGNKVEINSQLLSETNNIVSSEVFLKLSFNKETAEHNFNFSKDKIQSINLSEKYSLVVSAEWYTEGVKIVSENLNSKVLSQYKRKTSSIVQKQLKSIAAVKPGEPSLIEALHNFNNTNCAVRIVSLTSNAKSDISAIKLKLPKANYQLSDLLNEITKSTAAGYFVDGDGILIDCQGTIKGYRDIVWNIEQEKVDSSYYRFNKGAFIVNKEGLNSPVVYLPSANALVGYSNSKILK